MQREGKTQREREAKREILKDMFAKDTCKDVRFGNFSNKVKATLICISRESAT